MAQPKVALKSLCNEGAMKSHFPPLSAPDDYESVMTELTFSAQQTRQCVNVTILDDVLLEGVEDFSANLSTADGQVALDPQEAAVTIVDNDGRFHFS